MTKANVPFLSFNRGLISPKALARVDIEKLRLAAEEYTNWLPKTTGAMTIRPGTKWLGSSLRDTGAEYLEFVASTDDVALIELTHEKMRVWLGTDAHNVSLLGRPLVDTTLTLSDTGWADTSTGGAVATSSSLSSLVDVIPTMTASATSGVTITALSENVTTSAGNSRAAWRAADDTDAPWDDTGESYGTTTKWWKVDFGASNTKAVKSYSVQVATAPYNTYSPNSWSLISSNYDTGTFATDTGKWVLEDTQGSQTNWSSSERRYFTTRIADTGTVDARRYWRMNFLTKNGPYLVIDEIEMYTTPASTQVYSQGAKRVFNATSIGALARLEKRVLVSDTGTEHGLAITVERGPLLLRVGSSQRDDDYVSETSLGTGYHNLAFTPQGDFWVTLQTDALVNRIVSAFAISDSGTVEVTAPWETNDLANIRYDQSADVVYVDSDGVLQQKIERRGTGRSWSVVNYRPDNGPFLPTASSGAKLRFNYYFGNVEATSDIPFFTADHVGGLIRAFHEGQDGVWRLGADETSTDAIEVTGYSDTGGGAGGERKLTITVSGTWSGGAIVERSFNGPEEGFHPAEANYMAEAAATDTGSFTRTINDLDDNVSVYYRVRLTAWTSGVAIVTMTYSGGGVTGIARITSYNSNTSVDAEVLSRFSDTGPSDNWQEGTWSGAQGYPSSVALYGGRLCHASGGQLSLSVSDDYENYDDSTIGDAAPIVRTLGSGPVDTIRFVIAKLRLIIGTAGAELALATSSLDEPVTPTNCSARLFSTQGSANLRAVHLDTRAIHVQRSGSRLYMIGPSDAAFGDYASFDLTRLVPDLMTAGVVSLAVQRQPDTRIHCVLSDGTVAILTYEPEEEVVCWSTWEGDTGTGAAVEKVAVLPGTSEDAVFYHVRRTINGTTKRYLEKWSKESECVGDTGLTWIMDCAKSYTDTGRSTALTDVATHLVGESVVVWSDDTGLIQGVDRSSDVNGVQTRYTVDTGGDVTLSTAVHHAVAGLPYRALWKSAKLAYASEAGTGLAQLKRVDKIGFVLWQTHNNGLFFGNDTGNLDPLPRIIDEGAEVDADKIFAAEELIAMPFPGLWKADSRIVLQGKSPRPATVLAAIPGVDVNEKV
jgi:hypothetical protein